MLAQIGRDSGKTKEPTLFTKWSGKPTTRMLRHFAAPNKILLARRHRKLQELLPDIAMPTQEEERANPAAADEIYESCIAVLREKTRDKERFPLVFEENCNCGFRRNLWGMKPIGITMAAAGTIAVALLILLDYRRHLALPPLVIVCEVGNLLVLFGWLLWITPQWIKITADAYAERLLAACEDL